MRGSLASAWGVGRVRVAFDVYCSKREAISCTKQGYFQQRAPEGGDAGGAFVDGSNSLNVV